MADNTYIGYAERNAETQINWAQVGQDISEMLNSEAQIREQKKAAIDEETRQYQKALAESPRGNSEHLNSFTSDFVDQATEYKMMINQLLKSGQMKMKDYTAASQNLTDNTSLMFDVMNQAQEYYTKHMERLESGDASSIEGQIMEQIEAFSRLGSSRSYIDPGSGRISIGKLVSKDGVMKLDTSPGSNMSIGKLRDRLNTFVQRFDVDAELKNRETNLGEVSKAMVELSRRIGDPHLIRTIDDKKLGEYGLTQEDKEVAMNFMSFENDMIEEVLSNNTHAASILADGVGGYSITYSEEEAKKDPKKIFIDQSTGVDKYVFSDEQTKAAEDFLKLRFRSMIGVQEKATSAGIKPDTRRTEDIKRGSGVKKSANVMSNLALLYYGEGGELNQALGNLAGSDKKIKKMEKEAGGVRVFYQPDGNAPMEERFLSFYDQNGDLIPQEDFIKANASLFGITEDIDEALEKSKYDPNREFSTETGAYDVMIQTSEPATETFDRLLDEDLASFAPTGKTEAEFRRKINGILPTIPGGKGVMVSDTLWDPGESIEFYDQDGNVLAKLDLDEFDTLEEATEEAKRIVKGIAKARATKDEVVMTVSGKRKKTTQSAAGSGGWGSELEQIATTGQ